MTALTVRLCAFIVFTAAVANGGNRHMKTEEINHLRSQVESLREQLRDCSCNRERQMDVLFLENKVPVACNDKSPAGYYIRKSAGSKRWVIYLQGGGYCYDSKTCDERFRDGDKYALQSSNHWHPKKTGTGILSADIESNPSWWNANAVFVPYCSSDAWSGNQSFEDAKDGKVFMGARIITEVIRDLLEKRGMADASQVLLAGSSAGGIGVMLNIDRVAKQIKNAGCSADVRGLVDSGWFVDCDVKCSNTKKKRTMCSVSDRIKQGYDYWKAIVPDKCFQKHSKAPWKCFFGETLHSLLESQVFVSQWMYDEAQLEICGVRFPNTNRGFKTVQKLGSKVRRSLKSVRHLFAPSCMSHNLVVKDDWNEVKILNKSLPELLDCWFPILRSKKGCGRSRFVDECDQIQCNLSCPKTMNPYTGRKPKIPLKEKKSDKENPSEKDPY